ncbi:hypothetical protein C8J56DRAFT_1159729 [Mycena floridula]|nr:hypothetical protein C8J56DRAFT_1159729 [Mycena floridula]
MDARSEGSNIGPVGRNFLSRIYFNIKKRSRRAFSERRTRQPGEHATPGSESAREHNFGALDSVILRPQLVMNYLCRNHHDVAESLRKVTTVKVRGGPDPEKRIEVDIARYKRIRHPAIVRYIDFVTPASPPFAIFATALRLGGERDSLIKGASLMYGVASGLEHISKCFPLPGITLDLFIKPNGLCISLGMGELGQGQDGAADPVVVFHRLCYEAFQEAKREWHSDKDKVVNHSEHSETKSNSQFYDEDYEDSEPIPTPTRDGTTVIKHSNFSDIGGDLLSHNTTINNNYQISIQVDGKGVLMGYTALCMLHSQPIAAFMPESIPTFPSQSQYSTIMLSMQHKPAYWY